MTRDTQPSGGATAKGRATREHIVDVASELTHLRGVHGTTNDDVRKAAGVSGSQLTHYFPDKASLVRAVVARRADQVLVVGRTPPMSSMDSIAALRDWAAFFIEREDISITGCRFGSLASGVLKSHLDVMDEVANGFDRWTANLREGLSAMRDRGELRSDADPTQLAYTLLAAYQGGMLLAQAAQSVVPLDAALNGAIDHVASFVVPSE